MLTLNISFRRLLLKYTNPREVSPKVLNDYENAIAKRQQLLEEIRILTDVEGVVPSSPQLKRLRAELAAAVANANVQFSLMEREYPVLSRYYVMRRNFALKQSNVRHFNFNKHFNFDYLRAMINYLGAYFRALPVLVCCLRFLKK